MRYILIILLFIASESFGQVTITNKANSGPASTNATSYASPTFGVVAGRLYIGVALVTGATNDGSMTSASNTWTYAGSTGNSSQRIVVFKTVSVATVSEAVTFGSFGSTATGILISFFEVTGMDNEGTIVQVVPGGATGANPTLTLSTLRSNSAVFTAFMSDANPFSGTPEAGWTEHNDGGYTVPTTGTYFMYRGSTTDNTPTVTAASSTWIGLGIEVAASSRRVLSAN